jgi:cytochrome d ubiquinol oxidase subunit II
MDLQVIWFFLWGLLWAVFFMTDGFDFGVGALYPFVAKSERDKRVMINSLGPMWDGNEVWLLTAGGVTFAAFPKVYAVMFSSLYSALMLVLFTLIIRGVSFEFRGKVQDPRWLKFWDTAIFLCSALPAILFGVAFANIFKGIPIDAQGVYHGNLLTLLNPYGLLGGVLFLLLFLVHGALWLANKTEGDLQARAVAAAGRLWPALLVVAVAFLIASKFATALYDNYLASPVLFLVIAVTVAALLATRLLLAKKDYLKAFLSSAATIAGATFFGVIGLFPNMLPSTLRPYFSLTAYNSSSSPLTLKIMLTVVVLLIPVVIAYQIWAYRLFWGKVSEDDLSGDYAY